MVICVIDYITFQKPEVETVLCNSSACVETLTQPYELLKTVNGLKNGIEEKHVPYKAIEEQISQRLNKNLKGLELDFAIEAAILNGFLERGIEKIEGMNLVEKYDDGYDLTDEGYKSLGMIDQPHTHEIDMRRVISEPGGIRAI